MDKSLRPIGTCKASDADSLPAESFRNDPELSDQAIKEAAAVTKAKNGRERPVPPGKASAFPAQSLGERIHLDAEGAVSGPPRPRDPGLALGAAPKRDWSPRYTLQRLESAGDWSVRRDTKEPELRVVTERAVSEAPPLLFSEEKLADWYCPWNTERQPAAQGLERRSCEWRHIFQLITDWPIKLRFFYSAALQTPLQKIYTVKLPSWLIGKRMNPPVMFRFYDHFYDWGQIEPSSLNKHTIIEIEIFGHCGCCLLIVFQMTSLLSKNMKNLSNLVPVWESNTSGNLK